MTMGSGKAFDLRRHLPSVAFVILVLVLVAGVAGAFIFTGIYNVGADAPHSRFVYNALDTLRERSIARNARDIRAPADLDDPQRIAAGAGLYADMCSGCHLAPGLEQTELSQGLYPPAPALASRGLEHTPAEQFWAIKHGIKLSAMPAWGKTHDDRMLWDIVAFVRQLPRMSAEQYRAAVAGAPAGHDEMMEGMAGSARAGGSEPDHHADDSEGGHDH